MTNHSSLYITTNKTGIRSSRYRPANKILIYKTGLILVQSSHFKSLSLQLSFIIHHHQKRVRPHLKCPSTEVLYLELKISSRGTLFYLGVRFVALITILEMHPQSVHSYRIYHRWIITWTRRGTPRINITRRALECMLLFSTLGCIQLYIKNWFFMEGNYEPLYTVCCTVSNSTIMYFYLRYR